MHVRLCTHLLSRHADCNDQCAYRHRFGMNNEQQSLDLSRNQLNGFDDMFVVKLQRIKDVKLENNPLICDRCHLGSLVDIARSVSNIITIFFLFYVDIVNIIIVEDMCVGVGLCAMCD